MRIMCSGTFDLIHPGHVWFLHECKKHGEYLVVSVSPDENLIKDKSHPKYKRTRVMSQKDRAHMVSNIRCVDRVVKQQNIDPPLNILNDLLFQAIDLFVCSDDDPFKKDYKNICKEFKIKFKTINRKKSKINCSTTKLI